MSRIMSQALHQKQVQPPIQVSKTLEVYPLEGCPASRAQQPKIHMLVRVHPLFCILPLQHP